MQTVREALLRALGHLGQLDHAFALVGGLAVSARCEPRLTRDVDIAMAVSGDSDAEAVVLRLQRLGYRVVTTLEVAVQLPSRPTVSLDVQPTAAEHSCRVAQVASPRSETTQPQAVAPSTAAPNKPRTRVQPKIQTPAQQPLASTAVPVKVINFDHDDNVEGDRLDPDGVLIFVPAGVKYDSLIEVPTNFRSAFQKMIEDRL